MFFSGQTETGCGPASTDVGPFYCPADKNVYIDLGFFRSSDQVRGKGGPFAEAYVLAHEYGHHVQDLLGVLTTGSGARAPRARACAPSCRPTATPACGPPTPWTTGFLTQVSQADIAEALDAAAAVGDDRIQTEFQGRSNPETWTHGSSAAASALVHDRLPDRQPEQVRHLPRFPVTGSI